MKSLIVQNQYAYNLFDKEALSLEVNQKLSRALKKASDNRLFSAAANLLAVLTQLRLVKKISHLPALKDSLVKELIVFESNARDMGVEPQTIMGTQYVIAAAIDEAILTHQWQGESYAGDKQDWSKASLVGTYFQDSWGGEKFFVLVDRMATHPELNLEFLEVASYLLSLGFEGRYRLESRGAEVLGVLRSKLYRYIRHHRHYLQVDEVITLPSPVAKKSIRRWRGLATSVVAGIAGLLIVLACVLPIRAHYANQSSDINNVVQTTSHSHHHGESS